MKWLKAASELGDNTPESWLGAKLRELDSAMEASVKWAEHEQAEPPNMTARTFMEDVLRMSHDLMLEPTGKILPSYDGGLGVSFASKERCVTVECTNRGDILFTTSGSGHVWLLNILHGGTK